MKKLIKTLILMLLVVPSISFGQRTLSSSEMIAITPIVCDAAEIPSDAKKSLNMKMMQMVNMNGFASSSKRFALTPNIVVIDKQIAPTVPAMYSVEMELTFYLLDVAENIILTQKSVTIKGLDKAEHKAYIQAINSFMPAKSREIKLFMEQAREKILSYYKTRIPTLLKKAEVLAEQKKYGEAMAQLANIPESIEEYDMVSDALVALYKKKLDVDAQIIIQRVRTMIGKDNDGAIEELLKIDISSNYWNRANELISEIKLKVETAEREAIERRVEAAKQEAEVRKEEAAAAAEVAVIEAEKAERASHSELENSLGDFTKKVNHWFIGMFKPRR